MYLVFISIVTLLILHFCVFIKNPWSPDLLAAFRKLHINPASQGLLGCFNPHEAERSK